MRGRLLQFARRRRARPLLHGARASLIAFTAAIASVVPSLAPPRAEAGAAPGLVATSDDLDAIVREAALRFDLPTPWIWAVMRVESGGAVRAVSPAGAMGLMQIMPDTWSDLRARHGLGQDPFDARDNVLAGAAYLRELFDRYGAPGFLAAYNAGPRRYEDALARVRPLPAETRAYLTRLAPVVAAAQGAPAIAVAPQDPRTASLFPSPPALPSPSNRTLAPFAPSSQDSQSTSLFATPDRTPKP
jgi:soluble lytic murein transglycosylase-like protein